jgi:hypothetical protein
MGQRASCLPRQLGGWGADDRRSTGKNRRCDLHHSQRMIVGLSCKDEDS